jgi:methylated-DNA-protein-cysteine methyltransferase-like protein
MLSRVSRPRSRLSSQALWIEPRTTADPFCAAAREVIAAIPRGKVATYGQVAHLAGKPWGARQVAWILHSQSDKYKLPWQRVIGAAGRISLPHGRGLEMQRRLLRGEGVVVAASGRIDLGRFRWRPEDEFTGKKKGPAGPAPFI